MTTETDTLPAAAAGTWALGDLTVNRLGLGAMRLPQTGAAFDPAAAPRDRDQAIRVLRRAVELGVNHIDTAAFYFSATRSANELINRALAPYREELVIVTKVGPGRDPSGAWLPHAGPAQLRGQVEENLRQLGRDHLDVVNLRVLGDASVAERFGVLADLRSEGLIRHLGLSNIHPHQLTEAQAIAPVVCVQNPFGLGAATAAQAELLRTCGEQGVAFVPFYAIAGAARERGVSVSAGSGVSPDGGVSSGAAVPAEPPALAALARDRGVSTAQLRLAWTLHQGPHVLAIPGTGDPAHLEANVAAASLRLSADELAVLDGVHEGGAR